MFYAEEIRRLRRELGCTQRDFASRLKVPQSTVARWETAKAKPTADHLHWIYQLADANAVPFDPFRRSGLSAAQSTGTTLSDWRKARRSK